MNSEMFPIDTVSLNSSRVLNLQHIKNSNVTTVEKCVTKEFTGTIISLQHIKKSYDPIYTSTTSPILTEEIESGTEYEEEFEEFIDHTGLPRIRPNAKFLSRYVKGLDRTNAKLLAPQIPNSLTDHVKKFSEEDIALIAFRHRGRKELDRIATHYGLKIVICGESVDVPAGFLQESENLDKVERVENETKVLSKKMRKLSTEPQQLDQPQGQQLGESAIQLPPPKKKPFREISEPAINTTTFTSLTPPQPPPSGDKQSPIVHLSSFLPVTQTTTHKKSKRVPNANISAPSARNRILKLLRPSQPATVLEVNKGLSRAVPTGHTSANDNITATIDAAATVACPVDTFAEVTNKSELRAVKVINLESSPVVDPRGTDISTGTSVVAVSKSMTSQSVLAPVSDKKRKRAVAGEFSNLFRKAFSQVATKAKPIHSTGSLHTRCPEES